MFIDYSHNMFCTSSIKIRHFIHFMKLLLEQLVRTTSLMVLHLFSLPKVILRRAHDKFQIILYMATN